MKTKDKTIFFLWMSNLSCFKEENRKELKKIKRPKSFCYRLTEYVS